MKGAVVSRKVGRLKLATASAKNGQERQYGTT
jgi:hypothetical protein